MGPLGRASCEEKTQQPLAQVLPCARLWMIAVAPWLRMSWLARFNMLTSFFSVFVSWKCVPACGCLSLQKQVLLPPGALKLTAPRWCSQHPSSSQ